MYDDYRQHGRGQYEDIRQGAYGRSRQPQYGDRHEDRAGATDYSRGHEGGEFWGILREAAHGRRPIPEELRIVIEEVFRDQTERMLAEQGYIPSGMHGKGGELHYRYKEVLEKLREIPSFAEAVKQFPKYFDDLTEEERKVLTQKIQRPPLKEMAQNAGMSPEKFNQIDYELQYKLKY